MNTLTERITDAMRDDATRDLRIAARNLELASRDLRRARFNLQDLVKRMKESPLLQSVNVHDASAAKIAAVDRSPQTVEAASTHDGLY